MELTEEEKKAAMAAIAQAAREAFPTKKEKAKKAIKRIIESFITFGLSIAATAVGWNVCLCWVFPSLPDLTFAQLVMLHWGICFILWPITYTIIKTYKENRK